MDWTFYMAYEYIRILAPELLITKKTLSKEYVGVI